MTGGRPLKYFVFTYTSKRRGGGSMTTFEAIYLMIEFATLVVVLLTLILTLIVLLTKKK